jgi:hypothetical protein
MSIHKICIEDPLSISGDMGKHHSSRLRPHAISNIMFAVPEEPSDVFSIEIVVVRKFDIANQEEEYVVSIVA